ncbi:unnamed protein product [Blepharisma stoltei]|uniref:Uncharacterized protein n=1 Tax=Blepharisma stoltei TaxID=1481888 RepID=A0AAU9KD25_9CILI|nr:unnamed protein product [Blepharisma stoltei]
MDILYKPPMNQEVECKMLEKNYVTCLHEKSVKDVDVPMKCNVERILWFNVDCPTRYERFTTPEGLKSAYEDWKKGTYDEA